MKRAFYQLIVSFTVVSVLLAQEPPKSASPPTPEETKSETGKKPTTGEKAEGDQPAKKDEAQAKKDKKPEKDKRIRLLVRGDCFGATHTRNVVLEEAFTDSIMMSAAVMAPGPWFSETVSIVSKHPEWCIGLHLTLNSEWRWLRWRPIAPAKEVPSLVGSDGFFYWNHWKTGAYFEKSRMGGPPTAGSPPVTKTQPDPADVEKELRAQIQFAKGLGLRIDYLDCHMRTASTDGLKPVVQKLSKEFCLPVPEEGLLGEKWLRARWDNKTAESAKEGLKELLRALPPGLWKIVGFPSMESEEIRAVDPYFGPQQIVQHTAMFEAWKDPEVKQIIAELGIELVSVRDLWDYEKCEPK